MQPEGPYTVLWRLPPGTIYHTRLRDYISQQLFLHIWTISSSLSFCGTPMKSCWLNETLIRTPITTKCGQQLCIRNSFLSTRSSNYLTVINLWMIWVMLHRSIECGTYLPVALIIYVNHVQFTIQNPFYDSWRRRRNVSWG